MARKSNKTAHVLNLLSGHDTQNDAPAEETNASGTEEQTSSPQNISVVDTTETDPVAQLIQDKLSDELEKQLAASEIDADAKETSPVSEEILQEEAAEIPETSDSLAEEPEVSDTSKPLTEEPEVSDTSEPLTEEPEVSDISDPLAEEPDFVMLNVMERIVRDKIIYFMRQFDVCTCERCIADTVALTLNGIAPKYIVCSPAAVEPLLSFYTNKYISDITVEATKACMTIKENPRH